MTAAAMNGSTKAPVICVFCGARPGNSPIYLEAARSLAQALHSINATLVYGGGNSGIMGEVARTLVQLSGPDSVHGIIPEPLMSFERSGSSTDNAQEKTYGRTTITKDMHSRKALMTEQVVQGGPGSGFVALPGGYGTLEELMEVATWNQLGIHDRGIVVFNVGGYWDHLLEWISNAVSAEFVAESNRHIMLEATSADQVVAILKGYQNTSGRLDLKWHQK